MHNIFDIYINNDNNSSRYALGNSGNRTLIVFGVNPSIANQLKSDNTISKIKNFSAIKGYDSFIVFNIYPKRSTDPKKLPKRIVKADHLFNVKIIKEQLINIDNLTIWAAWGDTIGIRSYLIDCLSNIKLSIESYKPKWINCGSLTRLGHPRHPSRLGYKNNFFDFDIDSYLNSNK